MEAKQFAYLSILDLKKLFFFLSSLYVEMTSQLISAMVNSEGFIFPEGLLTRYELCALSLSLLTVPH